MGVLCYFLALKSVLLAHSSELRTIPMLKEIRMYYLYIHKICSVYMYPVDSSKRSITSPGGTLMTQHFSSDCTSVLPHYLSGPVDCGGCDYEH